MYIPSQNPSIEFHSKKLDKAINVLIGALRMKFRVIQVLLFLNLI